jgi:predicted molibdopterin-dependent oxidoreductase YjgC
MCDVGRLGYRDFNRRDRADQPLAKQGNAYRIIDWDDAIPAAGKLLSGKRVTVVASPNLSNEALFLLERIIKATGGRGVFRVKRGPEAPLPGVHDLSLRAERAANATAARLLGFTEVETLDAVLESGDALFVVDDQFEGVTAGQLTSASAVVYAGTALPEVLAGRVDIVLPLTNVTEEEGTLTNLRGRVQRFLQARTAPGVARPSWYVLADMYAALGGDAQFYLPSEVFAALVSEHAAFAGLDYEGLGLHGLTIAADSASAAATQSNAVMT